MEFDKKRLISIINSALKEDIGPMDITTSGVIPKTKVIKADILTKEDGIVCGLPLCETVFEILNKDIKFKPQVNEGDAVHSGKVLCYLEGPARPILTGERTALNFIARLSGIAAQTRKFAEKAAPYGVKIMDTRKTAPCLRYVEKYAVRMGGGCNHRMGLWDQVLIKDNHLKAVSCQPSAISRLLKETRKKVQKNTKIEIEVKNLIEFEEALKGRPDIIMLDNMSTSDIERAVSMRDKLGNIPLIEVSGNITIGNLDGYAKCRPDIISVGAITHSFKSLDLSMEVYGRV